MTDSKVLKLDRILKDLKSVVIAFSGGVEAIGFKHIIDGTNAGNKNEYRPGLRALNEMGIVSPLAEAGLTKKEIRMITQEAGLELWDKPAMACLLTRIPYDTEVSEGMLRMIETAEDLLLDKGYPGTRVRVHGEIARIECMPGFIEKLINDPDRDHLVRKLKKTGFRFVSLDL